MRVLKLLQHFQLVVDHALVSADILLEDNLDRNLLAVLGLGLTDDAICARTECASKPVQGPVGRICLSAWNSWSNGGFVLLLVALWLSRQLVKHVRD